MLKKENDHLNRGDRETYMNFNVLSYVSFAKTWL